MTPGVTSVRIRAIPMPGPPSMFDTPPVASPVPPALSNYIQPNLAHGLRIWWAFFWPTTLISIVMTIVVNYWARYFYENSNVPGSLLRPILRYDSYFFSYATAFFVMNYILRKNLRQFRIGLLSLRGEIASEPLQPTLRLRPHSSVSRSRRLRLDFSFLIVSLRPRICTLQMI